MENTEVFRELIEQHKLIGLKFSNADCETNRDNNNIFLKNKTKYIYVDVGQKNNKYHSGLYLIDKEQNVFSIKAYGKKGYFRGTIDTMNLKYKEDIENMKQALLRRTEKGSYGNLTLNFWGGLNARTNISRTRPRA